MAIQRDLRIAIVDDESESRSVASSLLEEYARERDFRFHITPYDSGENFLDLFGSQEVDLVLMDIFMEGIDGATCAARMREQDPKCLLVFLTTSQEHMAQAFSSHAFEYISKPLTKERLSKVLDDALRVIPAKHPSIEIICERQSVRVDLHEICSVVSDAHYLQISTHSGMRRTRLKMDEFFSLVEHDPRFIRINKGIAINADRVLGFEHGCCLLDDGSRLPIRTKDRRSIEAQIRQYNFDSIRASQRRAL